MSSLDPCAESEGTVCVHAAAAAAGQPNLLTPAQRPLENSPPPPSQSRGSDWHCECAICPSTRLHSALGQEILQHSRLNMKYRAGIVAAACLDLVVPCRASILVPLKAFFFFQVCVWIWSFLCLSQPFGGFCVSTLLGSVCESFSAAHLILLSSLAFKF